MTHGERQRIARSLVQAITTGDDSAFEQHVAEDVILRIWDWRGREICRPRSRAFERLTGEWSAWDRPSLDVVELTTDDHRTVMEFQVFTTTRDRAGDIRPVEHNRMLAVDWNDDSVVAMNLYCAHPVSSNVHHRLTAERDPSPEILERYIAAMRYSSDTRRRGPANWSGRYTLELEVGGTGNPHPSANMVKHARLGHLSDDELDARITEIIEYHRQRDLGFSWLVGSYDTPADLGERLLAHGLVRAAHSSIMVRPDLPIDEIPHNPDLEIQIVGPEDHDAAEAALQIVGVAFQWTPDRLAEMREFWFERFHNPRIHEHDTVYLGRLEGRPAGFAAWTTRGGLALFDGAATLPEFRKRRVYSTLLRRRIEDARAAGFTSMVIEAQPMSRRVVARYGFEERGGLEVYGWMPVMDRRVIDSLVQHDGNQPGTQPGEAELERPEGGDVD